MLHRNALLGGIFKKQECLKSQLLLWTDSYLKFEFGGLVFSKLQKCMKTCIAKSPKCEKWPYFLSEIEFWLSRNLNSWHQIFRNYSSHRLLRIPRNKIRRKAYTLLFWWQELKMLAKNGHMAKMPSYWLPEKCHISAPRMSWETKQVWGRSTCSCKALHQVSACKIWCKVGRMTPTFFT